MRAAILLAAVSASGCATSWVISQAMDKPQVWDEGVREVKVPEAGVTERLTVTLPLETQYEPPPYVPAGQVAPPPKPLPFALACSTDQDARDLVYHSAFRYGSRWKKGTAIALLLEGALATALYFAANDQHPEDLAYAGFFGVDAAVTGALFFAPRKEIYRRDERPIATHVRSDCPDGLELAIAGTAFPVDAAGRIGELGDTALAEWMKAPRDPIEVRVSGQGRALPIGEPERCTWVRDHDHAPCNALMSAREVATTLLVAPGTLARE